MTTPRSRSTELTRHVVATAAGPPVEDTSSNSDLVSAAFKVPSSENHPPSHTKDHEMESILSSLKTIYFKIVLIIKSQTAEGAKVRRERSRPVFTLRAFATSAV